MSMAIATCSGSVDGPCWFIAGSRYIVVVAVVVVAVMTEPKVSIEGYIAIQSRKESADVAWFQTGMDMQMPWCKRQCSFLDQVVLTGSSRENMRKMPG
jgi:hypothetical protein